MSRIDLGAWNPDQAINDASALSAAVNVFPQTAGYGPVPSPVVHSLPLPAAARGAIDVLRSDGTWVRYAGTATKLYRSNPATQGWDDVSGTSAYQLPPEDYWSFALYGPLLIAVHQGARPQTIDIDSGATFTDLAYTSPDPPPRARFVAIVNEFVFLGGLLDNEAAVQWSGIADPHYWTPGINDSDIQILPDGGNVTGLVGGEVLIAFQERAIQEFVFNAGTSAVFTRSKLEDVRGAVAPWSIARVGGSVFFLDRDGFYMFNGGASQPIGKGRVNGWFLSQRDPTYVQTAVVVADPTGTRIIWAFKSRNAADATVLDLAICYDYVLDRWTQITLPQPIRWWSRSETSPVTLGSITESLQGTTPYNFAGGLSLNSAVFSGGVPLIGVYALDNTFSLLEGPSLPATLETSDVQLARPGRSYLRGVRVDTDAEAWTAAIGTRESLSAATAIRWRFETPPNRERFAYCQASGRYHRARINIAAGDAWTYVSAIEPDATAEGAQ